jgi:hypothetical protein
MEHMADGEVLDLGETRVTEQRREMNLETSLESHQQGL